MAGEWQAKCGNDSASVVFSCLASGLLQVPTGHWGRRGTHHMCRTSGLQGRQQRVHFAQLVATDQRVQQVIPDDEEAAVSGCDFGHLPRWLHVTCEATKWEITAAPSQQDCPSSTLATI
jgi:hypothetical protein